MNRTTVIYGPPGSGKTRNAKRLATHYGCTKIIDGWEEGDPMVRDALHLTIPRPIPLSMSCRVIPIDQALREMGDPVAHKVSE